ncbi:unnamed protein product [Tilletia caries]|uniref:ferroxidase n=1 Tax=Tilletia caries TaxID=13290 RepID=A0A8T8TK81_9BASI|nr:hypothetical protein CF336_g3847 [Tilletia laevis]KAE8262343.1 hypothetical protein A4X03_0g2531 [Tilletia caries]KAE8203351.1 hypothetical protein CF335_g3056 [Tilletia laevis]CAD6886510.1 unnamed protein product [Tilletia caries]CAD6918962.1 unnamed protein product [Tilletia caries]
MNTLPTRVLAQRAILRPPFVPRALAPSLIREHCAAVRHAITSIAAASPTARAPSRSDQAQHSTSRSIHHSAPSHSHSHSHSASASPPPKPTPTPLSPEEYDTKASQTLESLTDSLETLLERIQDGELSLCSTTSSSSAEEWDVEYSSGVLNLRLGKAHGTYVLNKQPPNRQIWLSSPSSGPKRFDYEASGGGEGDRWVCRREGLPGGKVTLKGLVERELGMLTGLEVEQLGLRFEADS